MKREQLVEIVKAFTADMEKGSVDETALAVHLLTEKECSLSDVKAINACLIEIGLKDKIVQISQEEKKVVEKACTKKALREIHTHKDMREFAEGIESDLSDKDTLKVVAAQMKAKEFDVPKKLRLGTIKEAILDYFMSSEDNPTSAKGLSQFLQDNVIIGETPIDSEKADKMAMSNYTFTYMAYNRLSLDDIN